MIGKFTISDWRNLLAWVRDGIYPNKASVAARVRNTNTQSIPSSVETALIFNTVDYDTNSMFSSVKNTRLTCPKTGYYYLAGGVRFQGGATATGDRLTVIRINGSLEIARQSSLADVNANELSVSTPYLLNTSDYMELIGWQIQGATINTDAFSWAPFMSMTQIC